MAAREFMLLSARSARRLTAVSATAVALGTVSLAAIPAAQAAPGAAARVASPAAHRVLPAKVVTCRAGVVLRFPHPITSVGKVRCTRRVPRIAMLVRIIRNGVTVRSRIFRRSFGSSLFGAVSMRCRRGFFEARIDVKVTLPSGRVLRGAFHTRTIRVRC